MTLVIVFIREEAGMDRQKDKLKTVEISQHSLARPLIIRNHECLVPRISLRGIKGNKV